MVMRYAVGRWWRDDAGGAPHLYLPCELRCAWPLQCNPTCPGFSGDVQAGAGGAAALSSAAVRVSNGTSVLLVAAIGAVLAAALVLWAFWLLRRLRTAARGRTFAAAGLKPGP